MASPYDAALVEELRAYNATLTPAGQRTRPGRGQGTAVVRGRGGGASMRPVAGTGRYGSLGNHSVRSSNSPSATLATFAQSTKANAPGAAWTAAGMYENTSHNRTPAATTVSSAGQARARSESVTAHLRPTNAFAGSLPVEDPDYLNLNRKVIITNWSEDRRGPFIPVHLKQPSAIGTILEIHKETGIPLGQLTSDGVSIPAAKPRAAFEQDAASSFVTSAPVPSRAPEFRQSDVSAADFFGTAAYTSYYRRGTVNASAVASPQASFAGSQIEDDDVDGAIPPPAGSAPKVATLKDSVWATSASTVPTARPASAMTTTARFSMPSAPNYPVIPAFGRAPATLTAPVQPPPYAKPAATISNSIRQPGMKYLTDSMWA